MEIPGPVTLDGTGASASLSVSEDAVEHPTASALVQPMRRSASVDDTAKKHKKEKKGKKEKADKKEKKAKKEKKQKSSHEVRQPPPPPPVPPATVSPARKMSSRDLWRNQRGLL